MKKIVLLLITFLFLFASKEEIKLFSFKEDAKEYIQNEQNATIQKIYKIKLGSFLKLENANKFKTKDTYVHKLKKYYSVLSKPFIKKEDAIKALNKWKKKYKDAYIIELFEVKKRAKDNKKDKKKVSIAYKQPTTLKFSKKQHEIKKIVDNKKYKLDDFAIGIKKYNEGNYEEALMAFDRVLINDPNNQRAKLEYAKTLFMLGFYNDAQKIFIEVLKTSPPSNVIENIEFFLTEIENRKKRNFFFGSVALGGVYDDNINNNTFLETTSYADFNLSNDTNKTKKFYQTFELALSHIYVAKLFKISNTFFSYNEFGYDDRINYIDFRSHLLKSFTKTRFSFGFNANKVYLGGDNNSYSLALNSLVDFTISKNLISTIKFGFEKYNHEDINKSSDIAMAQIGFRYKYFHSFINYKKYSKQNGDRFDISKDEVTSFLGISYILFKNVITNFHYYFISSQYTDLDPGFGFKRKDEKHRGVFSLRYYFLKNFSSEFSYNYITNRSNINAYTYNKNNFLIKLSYDF